MSCAIAGCGGGDPAGPDGGGLDGGDSDGGGSDGAVGSLDDGLVALRECDVRAAHAAFDAAWAADPDDGRAAVGFALTDLIVMFESEEVARATADWGFTSAFDTEQLLWGDDGFLAAMMRHDRCDDVGNAVQDAIPHPAVRDSSGHPYDFLSSSLTGDAVLARLRALDPRLQQLAMAFESAARNLDEPITIGCGVGTVRPQEAELFAIAAGIEGLRAAIQLAHAYDWDFSVKTALEYRGLDEAELRERARVLNEHLGHVTDASAAESARDILRRAFELSDAALQAVERADGVPSSGLTDHRAIPSSTASEAREILDTAERGLDGPVTAPGLTPSFSGDPSKLFEDPVDAADFGNIFIVQEDPTWGEVWMEVDLGPIEEAILTVIDRSPFEVGSVEWSFLDAFREIDPETLVDPSLHYGDIYRCE